MLGVLVPVDDLDDIEHTGAVGRNLGIPGEPEQGQILGGDEAPSSGDHATGKL